MSEQSFDDRPGSGPTALPAALPAARERWLRELFEQQIPFHRHLGLRCGPIVRGAARVELPPRAEHIGDPWRPALHGGVIATLIDVAGGLAAFTAVGAEDRVSTIDLRVDYLLPAQVDRVLIAEARLLRAGTRVIVAEINVHHGDPTMSVARGAAVYNALRRSEAE